MQLRMSGSAGSGSASATTSIDPRSKSASRRLASKSDRAAKADGRRSRARPSSARSKGRTPSVRNLDRRNHQPVEPSDEVDDIVAELAGIEGNIAKILQNVQRETTTSLNYMLDAVMANTSGTLDSIRGRLEHLHRLREGNQKAETQVKFLNELQ